MQNVDDLNTEDLLENKIKEMKEIQNAKVKLMEKKLQEKDEKLLMIDDKYKQLETNFNYNLQVIEQKDKDIQDLIEKINQFKEICEKKTQETQAHENESQKLQLQFQQQQEKQHDQTQVLYEKIEELKQENKFLKSNFQQEQTNTQSEQTKLLKQLQDAQSQIKQLNEQHLAELQKMQQGSEQDKVLSQQNYEKLISQLKNDKFLLESDLKKQNSRLLDENERLLNEVKDQKEKQLIQQKEFGDENIIKQSKINELTLKNESLQKELDNIKNTNKGWEQISKEKIDIIMNEKSKLSEELTKYKLKHKDKFKEFKQIAEQKLEEIIRENNEKIKFIENQNKELLVNNEHLSMSENILREKQLELTNKYKKEIEDLETKFKQTTKNFEEDKRQLKNDIEVKAFHIKQLTEERETAKKQLEESNKQLTEVTNKLNEAEKENNILIQEVVKYRKAVSKGGDQLLHLQKSGYAPLEKKIDQKLNPKLKKPMLGSKVNPSHGKKFSEEEDENLPGIGDEEQNEVQSYVQMFTDDEGPVKSIFNKEKYLQLSEQGNILKTSQSLKNLSTKYNQAVKQIKDYESELQNYKNIIDSMTKDMENVKTKQMLNNQEMNLIKEENMHLRQRISEYQIDLMQYKDKAMKGDQGNNKQGEELQQKLTENQLELKKSVDKYNKLKVEADKLKNERDKLIEISNNLRSRLNELEEANNFNGGDEDHPPIDVEKLRTQNEVAYERIQELEKTIADLRQELERWQNLDQDKQAIIEKLRQQMSEDKKFNNKGLQPLSLLPYKNSNSNSSNNNNANNNNANNNNPNNNNPNNNPNNKLRSNKSPPQREGIIKQRVPKYDNFMDINRYDENIDKFTKNLGHLQEQLESNKKFLELDIQAKPLVQKGDSDPRDNSIQYQKNSEKSTNSQKKAQQKLQNKPTPQKMRNYLVQKDLQQEEEQ